MVRQLLVLTLLLQGCSMAFNTASGACYHGTILDVRNGGWDQTCSKTSDMTAFHEPMSEEFKGTLKEMVSEAVRAGMLAAGIGAPSEGVGSLLKLLRRAEDDPLAGTRNTPDGRVPILEP